MNDESNDLINQESSSEITTEQVTGNNVITEEPTVEPVTENSEPVISDSVETPIIDSAIVENSESIKKAKKPINKKLLFIIIGILLVAIIAVILIVFVFGKGGEKDSFKDPFTGFKTDGFTEVSETEPSEDFTQGKKTTHSNPRIIKYLSDTLTEDYKSGKITADEYVMQALYSVYDSNKLASQYKSLINSGEIIDDVIKFVGEDGDKLSIDTLKYFFEKVYLINLDELNAQKTSLNGTTYSVKQLASGDVGELDKAVLSSNKHFIVYYTNKGVNASSESYAKKVAEALEYAVTSYKKTYGYDYKFELNSFYKANSALLKKSKLVLENSNIDSSLIDKTMPVYILDFHGSIIGKYNGENSMDGINRVLSKTYPTLCKYLSFIFTECQGISKVDEESMKTLINALTSIYVSPSFMMDNDADDNELKVIAMHELFHHYQHTHICNGTTCNGKEFPSEPAANLAVIQNLSTDKITNTTLNGHAYYFTLQIAEGVENTREGYPSFVFAYNYANIVNDGAKKFFNAERSSDPLRNLDEQSGGKYAEVMLKTVEGIMTLNYKNKYLVPYAYDTILFPEQYADVIYSDNFSFNKNIKNTSAQFYYISKNQMSSMADDTQLVIKDPDRSSNNNQRMYVEVFIKSKSNSPYVPYYKQNFDKEFVINPKDFAEYEEVVYAIVNTNFGLQGSYDLIVEKHGTRQKSVKFPEVINTGISDYQLAKARTIYCKRKEDNSSTMTQTTEVLVNYKDSTKIKDMYVKETLDASSLDSSSPAYNLAKQLMDVSFKGIEQLFNMYFKQAKTIYEKKDLKYSLTVKLPEKYFDNLGDVYNFQGNRKIDIINGLTEEGFACYLK